MLTLFEPSGRHAYVAPKNSPNAVAVRTLMQRSLQNTVAPAMKTHFSAASMGGIGLKPTVESADPPVLSETYIADLVSVALSRPSAIPPSRTGLVLAADEVISELSFSAPPQVSPSVCARVQ